MKVYHHVNGQSGEQPYIHKVAMFTKYRPIASVIEIRTPYISYCPVFVLFRGNGARREKDKLQDNNTIMIAINGSITVSKTNITVNPVVPVAP